MLYDSRDANVGALALASYIMKSQHRCSAPFFRRMFAFPKFSTRDMNLGKVLNAKPHSAQAACVSVTLSHLSPYIWNHFYFLEDGARKIL